MKFKNLISFLPNTLTLLNLLSGLSGIIIWQHNIYAASVCLFASLVFDFSDGFAARILHSSSDMGKELDSLSDIVSFGVLPVCILLGVLFPDFYWYKLSGIPFYALLLFIIPICSAIRLAKFNISGSQLQYFSGLPTPANALWIASLPFILLSTSPISNFIQSNIYVLYILLVIFSFLMVLPVPMMTLKIKTFQWSENKFRYYLLIISLMLFFSFGWAGLPLSIILYVVLSQFSYRSEQLTNV